MPREQLFFKLQSSCTMVDFLADRTNGCAMRSVASVCRLSVRNVL